MLVYESRKISGTVGGGKFEALVVEESLAAMHGKMPVLKTYPLHECAPDSFGAVCGGEVTVLIEPQLCREAIYLVGAGHCSCAIARLARECGLHIAVVEDRTEALTAFADADETITGSAPEFIAARDWQQDEALVLVSRNYGLDRDALLAALHKPGAGYIGMIGSRRKVARVFEELKQAGITDDQLARVYAPIGFDVGADAPAEIAVSVIAEVLQVLRGASGGHLRASGAGK